MFHAKSQRQIQTTAGNCIARRRLAAACIPFERLEARQLMSASSLDPNFGASGKVADDFGGFRDHANAVVVDAYGRSYIAATTDEQLFVARYTKGGVLDNTFGTGGRTFIDTKGAAQAVGICDDDGKLTVVANDYGSNDIIVARLSMGGQIDKTFNGTGSEHIRYEVPFGYYQTLTQASRSTAAGVAVRSGKILVGGTATAYVAEPSLDERFAIVRLNTNGVVDAYFGKSGYASNEFIKDNAYDHQEATCMTLQKDGRILIGGRDNLGWGISRFNFDGSLDKTFNYSGSATPSFGSKYEIMTSVDVNDAGYIITGGLVSAGNTTVWGLAMLNPNGSPKNTFGYAGNGRETLSTGGATGPVASLKYQSDGRILALGQSKGTSNNFQLARINPNGTFDSGFGFGGYTYVDFKGHNDQPAAMTIAPYGKIVLAGSTEANGNSDIALARVMGHVCQYSITKYSDGIAGTKNGAFLIHRNASDPYAFDSTVLHFTISGTAKLGIDYHFSMAMPITFQPGQTTMYIEVQTVKNYLPTTLRTVNIHLNADPAYLVLGGDVSINIAPK